MHPRVSVAEVMGGEVGRDGCLQNLQEPFRAQKAHTPQCIRINPLIVSGMGF